MKLRFRIYNYEGYMGGICFDGTIDLHPRLLSKPMVLMSVLLHKLIHWTLDAVGLYGKIHDWNDLLYSYVGLYDYDVNRVTLRKTIGSSGWDKLAQGNLARRKMRASSTAAKLPSPYDGRLAFSPLLKRLPQKRTFAKEEDTK